MTVGSRFLTLWTNANSHHVGITYQKSDLRWANMPLRTVPLRLWRISQGYLNTRSWNLVQEGSSLSISKDSEKYTCNHICAHITLPRHMLYSYVISFNDSTTKLKHYQYRRIGTFGHFTKFDTRQIFHYTIYVYVCVLQLTVHTVLYTVHECIFPTAIWRKTAEGELGIPWWAWWKRERWARERRPR